MSVIGFDIGNESCVVAAAKRGGVDVLLNAESKRETPAVVSFGEKQRFLGAAGAAFATANPKSTISQIKRLIGKVYKEVEEELKLLPFVTSEGPRGGILIELEYLKNKWSFTPVEILGMLFKHLKQIAKKNLESSAVDCVIGIPSYFTDLQRRLYLDAAQIAGLTPLSLMHDGTAIALGYGMYKTDLSNSGPTYVMFVDIGHCDTQVTVAAFEQGKTKIMSHSFDQNLGGRDFDEVLFNHFAAQFNEKHKIDVYSNARASVRLRASCEKVKKVLSANAEAPLSIECLIGDTDVRGIITRDEFENLSSKLLERVVVPCRMALKDAGLSVDELYTIELVGSGSRVPAITRKLTSFLKKEPTRTLNASECVARGCALRCAMLSPTLVVRDYKIDDSFPYSIVIPTPKKEVMVFPKGSPFPNEQMMKRNGYTSFDIQLAYIKERDFPAGISHMVGRFEIGSSEPSDEETAKVEFRVKLNEHGIVEIDSATILEDKRHNSWKMILTANTHTSNLPASVNLDISTTNDELHEAKEKEKKLTKQDIKVEETKDQRNSLESFVYDTRSKLSGAYRSFASDLEKEVLTNNLQETEDWLYEDSDDEFEQDYNGRLKDLKKLLEPIEYRYNEENAIAKATKALQGCIAKYRSCADSLQADKKEKIERLCTKAEQWHINADIIEYSPPNTLSADINRVIEIVERDCESIRHEEPVHSKKGDQPVESDQKDQPVDSEKARIEAIIKPLQDCIAKYHLEAESLPDDQKEKVKNECIRAEQWLNDISQKNLSPHALETNINNAVEGFKRDCISIIKSKPSFSRHEEPVDSKNRDPIVESDKKVDQPGDSENARTKATKPLQARIERYRSHAESLPADKKEGVKNICIRAEKWLNDLSQMHISPYDLKSHVDHALVGLDRECEMIIISKPSSPRHEETKDSDSRDQPMDMDQVDQPVDYDQQMDTDQIDQRGPNRDSQVHK
ncbi:putative Heat shock protein 70 family [Helianthus debilis subsp. tardiflorus]